MRYGTVWGSASGVPSSPRGGARPPSPGGAASSPGLARRDVLMQQRALVAVRPDATLAEAVQLMVARHARAVFVTDDASRPLSVVTPTDILRLITEDQGFKARAPSAELAALMCCV